MHAQFNQGHKILKPIEILKMESTTLLTPPPVKLSHQGSAKYSNHGNSFNRCRVTSPLLGQRNIYNPEIKD